MGRGAQLGKWTGTWLGRVGYAEGERAMREAWHRVQRAADARAELLALEVCESVVTAGRRVSTSMLHSLESRLGAAGVRVVRVDRGGLLTWHGPGQLVLYGMVPLAAAGLGPRSWVEALAGAAVDWLATVGIDARWSHEHPGVWVGASKVASVGVRVEGGVTRHGMALNLRTGTAPWHLFAPCGLEPRVMGSLDTWLGARTPSPEQAARGVVAALGRRVGVSVVWAPGTTTTACSPIREAYPREQPHGL